MRIIAGLGNPGDKHARNRHNIGFMAVDRIAEDHGFGPWRRRFNALVAEGRLGANKVILLKPQTYMNNSGQPVGEALRFYKLAPEDLLVIHDELDLAPGKVRFKQGGGHAGHNGLRSIHAHVGPDYARLRLGIGHPGHKDRVAGYVLSDFPRADRDWLDELLAGISEGAEALAAGDGAGFHNRLGRHMAPRRAPRGATGRGATGRGEGKGKGKGKAAAGGGEAQPPEDTRSALERLRDRFR